jgi:hypothetical protein
LHAFRFSPIRAMCPSHLIPNYGCRRVQVVKLLVMQFSPLPCHIIPLGPKYSLLSTLFSNTVTLCSSLNLLETKRFLYTI